MIFREKRLLVSKPDEVTRIDGNFCWRLEGPWRTEQDPEPDPLVSGTDPWIRIRNQNVTDLEHWYLEWIINMIMAQNSPSQDGKYRGKGPSPPPVQPPRTTGTRYSWTQDY